MKTKLLVGVSVCGLMMNAVQAATFTCTIRQDKTVLATCQIDSANPSKTCEAKISAALQGTCGGAQVGPNNPIVICAFHDPNIKAKDAFQVLHDEREGKLTTPAGFLSGGSAIGTIGALAILYIEKSGAPQFSAGCAP